MAHLIDSRTVVEMDIEQVVAGLPVIEFVEELAMQPDFPALPRRSSGARLDRSLEVSDWFEQ